VRTLALVAVGCALLGCGQDPEATRSAGGAGGAGGEAAVDPFDPDHVLYVEIDMAPADWDALRLQTRSIFDVVGSDCLTQPPPSPFAYFSGSITIDGERIETVGVRKKGFFGSLSETKPAIKIKFDEIVPDQRYAGLTRLTLNNAVSDPSYVKQCLGYSLFEQAGVPASRCGFAHVTVNGQDLGLYVNVESIDKRFLGSRFADRTGNLYEGSLSDFRPGWVDTFEKKTNESDPDRSDLVALSDALATADSGVALRAEALVDVPEFTRFWATEYLLMHADGYSRNTNNFLVYHDPTTGKFSFIPWGIDAILFPDLVLDWEAQIPTGAAWTTGILARRLYDVPSARAAYVAALQDLLATVWDEAAIGAEIDRMAALLEPYQRSSEIGAWRDAVAGVRTFVQGRRAQVEAAMQTAADTSGPLRDPWCIAPIGTLDGTFDTTWDTFQVADPFAAGTGTLDLQIRGTTPTFMATGSMSGPDEQSGQPAVRLVAAVSETEIWVAQVSLTNPADFGPGLSIPIDWTRASGALIRMDLSVASPTPEVAGVLGDGVLEIDAAGTTPGAPVTGRIVATTLYQSPF
jgi:hypothetical protein